MSLRKRLRLRQHSFKLSSSSNLFIFLILNKDTRKVVKHCTLIDEHIHRKLKKYQDGEEKVKQGKNWVFISSKIMSGGCCDLNNAPECRIVMK